MATITSHRFEQLTNDSLQRFLLQCVSEWFAIHERVHGTPSWISFDSAWLIAEHVVDEIDGRHQFPNEYVAYDAVHAVLSAAHDGATSDQLRRGLNAFVRAMPATDAGMILLRSRCQVASAGDRR